MGLHNDYSGESDWETGGYNSPAREIVQYRKDTVLYFEYGQFRMPLGNKCADLQLGDLIHGSGPCERDKST